MKPSAKLIAARQKAWTIFVVKGFLANAKRLDMKLTDGERSSIYHLGQEILERLKK